MIWEQDRKFVGTGRMFGVRLQTDNPEWGISLVIPALLMSGPGKDILDGGPGNNKLIDWSGKLGLSCPQE